MTFYYIFLCLYKMEVLEIAISQLTRNQALIVNLLQPIKKEH